MRNSATVVALFGVLALAGCETPEERFERLLPAAQQRCSDFGFAEGSAAYTSCIQQEVNRLEDKEDEAAAALAASLQASQPKTCYTTGFGINSRTTCY